LKRLGKSYSEALDAANNLVIARLNHILFIDIHMHVSDVVHMLLNYESVWIDLSTDISTCKTGWENLRKQLIAYTKTINFILACLIEIGYA